MTDTHSLDPLDDVPAMDLDPKALTRVLERAKREGRHVTDDDLVDEFGAQTAVAIGANAMPLAQLHEDFELWYEQVMQPLNMEREATWKLYTGAMSIEDFVEAIPDAEVEDFVARYPKLQARYITTYMLDAHDTDED